MDKNLVQGEKRCLNPRQLTQKPVLPKIAVGTRFLYSRFIGFFLSQHSAAGIEIRHQQLYLFVLLIMNLEVVTWQLLSPPDLPRAQVFCIHKALEVVAVNKYKNFMFVAF